MLSNLLSNVPAVMLLKSLVTRFSNPHTVWLTLAMASTLAGNLTITGSVANIVVVERARKEAAITFFDYFRIGLPVTILTLTAGWLWLSWIQLMVSHPPSRLFRNPRRTRERYAAKRILNWCRHTPGNQAQNASGNPADEAHSLVPTGCWDPLLQSLKVCISCWADESRCNENGQPFTGVTSARVIGPAIKPSRYGYG